jgi:hypothetical protein
MYADGMGAREPWPSRLVTCKGGPEGGNGERQRQTTQEGRSVPERGADVENIEGRRRCERRGPEEGHSGGKIAPELAYSEMIRFDSLDARLISLII